MLPRKHFKKMQKERRGTCKSTVSLSLSALNMGTHAWKWTTTHSKADAKSHARHWIFYTKSEVEALFDITAQQCHILRCWVYSTTMVPHLSEQWTDLKPWDSRKPDGVGSPHDVCAVCRIGITSWLTQLSFQLDNHSPVLGCCWCVHTASNLESSKSMSLIWDISCEVYVVTTYQTPLLPVQLANT